MDGELPWKSPFSGVQETEHAGSFHKHHSNPSGDLGSFQDKTWGICKQQKLQKAVFHYFGEEWKEKGVGWEVMVSLSLGEGPSLWCCPGEISC